MKWYGMIWHSIITMHYNFRDKKTHQKCLLHASRKMMKFRWDCFLMRLYWKWYYSTGPEQKFSIEDLTVFVRRWNPSSLTLGPLQEIILKQATTEELKSEVIKFLIYYIFRKNISRFSLTSLYNLLAFKT